jgi:predicted TIM-barrel fold metal-dependent hydrolase
MAALEIVDVHHHYGDLSDSLGDYEGHGRLLTPEEDVRWRSAALDATGVSWAVIQPAHSYLRANGIRDTMRVNDTMARYRALDPLHFPMALGILEPTHGERSLEELERCKGQLKLNGISWHSRLQGVFIDNKWMRPVLKRMGELKMTPFIHTNPGSNMEAPWRLQKLACEFPDMLFLAMDGFDSYEQSHEVLHIAEHTPNIIWDLGNRAPWGAAERFIRKFGSDRFAFSSGSSYAVNRPSNRPPMLEAILRSTLPETDKANILSRNARRLFGLPAARTANPGLKAKGKKR